MLFKPCMNYVFLLLKTKEDILKNVSNQTVDGPHYSPPPQPMEVNGACAFLVAHILQNIFFCVQLKKKMDRIFSFG